MGRSVSMFKERFKSFKLKQIYRNVYYIIPVYILVKSKLLVYIVSELCVKMKPGTSPQGKRNSLQLVVGHVQDGEKRQLEQISRYCLQSVILQ